METSLQAFVHPVFGRLEPVMIDGKIHFPATYCAEVLGYVNPRDAIIRHCRGVVKHDITDSCNRERIGNYISEGDMYRLIAHSKLPQAEKFGVGYSTKSCRPSGGKGSTTAADRA